MALNQYNTFLKAHEVVENTDEQRKIVEAGERIAKAAQAYFNHVGDPEYLKDYVWEYNLLKDPQKNAWCMPGGKIVFYTGILTIAQNPDGLAAIMGHEVAHALLDHGGQRMTISLAQQGLSLIAIKTTENQPEKKFFLFGCTNWVIFIFRISTPTSSITLHRCSQCCIFYNLLRAYGPFYNIFFV